MSGSSDELRQLVSRSFADWLKTDVYGRAQLKTESYQRLILDETNGTRSRSDYCWITLNAVLKTEATVQMRFGMWLDAALQSGVGPSSEELTVLSEAPLRLQTASTRRRAKVDLAIYAVPSPLWDSKCSKGKTNYGNEAEDNLRGIIEVKLLSWIDPGSKFDNGQMDKDIEILRAARCKFSDIPLFHLVLDESSVNPAYQPENSPLAQKFEELKTAYGQAGVTPLSNNPILSK